MSAMLDRLLDHERLADIARNDVLMGLSAPPVEMDEAFFRRVDASEPTASQKAGRNDARALDLQVRQQAVADVIGRH